MEDCLGAVVVVGFLDGPAREGIGRWEGVSSSSSKIDVRVDVTGLECLAFAIRCSRLERAGEAVGLGAPANEKESLGPLLVIPSHVYTAGIQITP